MRERLIELLSDAEREHLNYEMANKFCPFDEYKCHSEYIADYLIENGVVALPCKVGDIVYQTDGIRIYELTILDILLHKNKPYYETDGIDFDDDAIGKTVFLTREEAEAKLKEGATE